MRVSLTDRVSIEARGTVIDEQRFPGRQGRLVFAYLLAEQGRPVSRGELADVLWGDTPPARWEKALSVLVSKLRVLLTECGLDGSEVLTNAFGCYQLALPGGTWVDVVAADEAVTAAERALGAGDIDRARDEAEMAQVIARRTFLPGEEGRWVDGERARLHETLVRALACLADANRLSGDTAAAVRAAEELIALEPFRESGHRQLMEAHITAGDRAEALRVYEECRRLLAEELGTYPSPETEALYRALLDAPGTRDHAAVPVEPPDPGGRETPGTTTRPPLLTSRIAAGLSVIALLASAGVLAFAFARDSGGAPSAVNAVVALDSSGSIEASVPVGARPAALAAAGDTLWVANLDDRSVTRVNVESGEASRTISVGDTPTGVAATSTAVWVPDSAGHVTKIDPRYDTVSFKRPVRSAIGFFGETGRGVLAAFGWIWMVSPDGVLLRLDQAGRVQARIEVGQLPSAVVAGQGSLWVPSSYEGTVTRVDPETLLTKTIPVGNGPSAVAVDAAGAWVANSGDNKLVRIDTRTNAVAETTAVGDTPVAVASTGEAVWVANSRDGTVMQLDPSSGDVQKSIQVGGTPTALSVTRGRVWVAIAPAAPQSPPEDGALLTTQYDFVSLDPGAYGTSIFYATCANLVAYPDVSGAAGLRIVPEVAERVPTPTDGGTTYTFRIRPGFRFSPPSNEPVTAMTFKSAIERVASPRLASIHAALLQDIVGFEAFRRGKAPGISGIVARGDTLTVRLVRPNGGLLSSLASGAACAVPRDTPVVTGLNDIPSAGPYYVASYTPQQQLVLRRNPNYGGDRPHHFEQIVVAIGVDPARQLEQVESGAADYALELPRDAGPRLEAAYGPESEAAKAGDQRYFINEANGARLLHMNTSRPLFSDARLRRAVSNAIDRPALVTQGRRFAEVNPFNAGTPTDDYVGPLMPGAMDASQYPTDGPDLREARLLAGRLRATAIMYTPNLSPWREEAQIIRRNLKPLGIEVQVKEFPLGDFFSRVTRPGESYDLAVSGYAYYPDPVVNLASLFSISTSPPPYSGNISQFTNPALTRELDEISKLSGAERYRAAARFTVALQRDHAPATAISTTAARDFFSARIGCQVYQPVWGMDIAALCLRE